MIAGDEVTVLDTSNGKELKGAVRRVDNRRGEVQVYVIKFGTFMTFINGVTAKGRFKLVNR